MGAEWSPAVSGSNDCFTGNSVYVEEKVYSSKEDFKYNIVKSKEIIWVSEGLYEFFDWNEETPPTGEIYEYW